MWSYRSSNIWQETHNQQQEVYCNGAGLHTECMLFSRDLAQVILDPKFVSENFYDLKGIRDRHPAPAYILEMLR
jgi:hypothetical protein